MTVKECLIEQWLPIEGYEGLYEVSNQGRVRSLDRVVKSSPKVGVRWQVGSIKNDVDNGKGYRAVNLYKNSKGSMRYVHRLVAIAFIPNPENKPQVNHKIGKHKFNNWAYNLEWATGSENEKHSVATGLNDRAYTRKVVIQLTIEGVEISRFESVVAAAKATGVCRSSIAECCVPPQKNRTYLRHEAGGYVWKYPTQD